MKKTKFREIEFEEGKLTLGKDEESNDELMEQFKGKENTIIHTLKPGSPFGVIKKLNPSKNEIYASGAIVAGYSQDWRDNKKNTIVNVFSGKNISKKQGMKPGTWEVKKSKKIKIKKEDIKKCQQSEVFK